VGYLDFNARQKILGAAKELEILFQTAQINARTGDLAGCDQLVAYQVTFNLLIDPVTAALTPLCQDGTNGLARSYPLVTGVTLAILPALTDAKFPALNGGVIFNPSSAQVDFTLATDSISQTYQMTLTRGGNMGEGNWQ
jgi:hypothetical protein